ncbi:hypothetical protein IW140_006029 [Coemansia sp. RSA 1813]|nr:hypothetical protein EV178_002402 [Coemansia sp. RSA 1646]KAJ1766275.1 hypothetical protein LPJ74_005964 [Coemansia sp. RSA 1843]KAJ2085993.1 hypothetical protein IW138_005979 [Coemansia sp. RSA 986]KAJ2215014.1 hypothetical protein EV179_002544 [Coemansia sp. RSA 487]KAJ2563658.1 hypothetical protein IW140_006029 [Coemansia sp. RSA 1813]
MAAIPQARPPPRSLSCRDFPMTLSETDLDALNPGEWVTDDVIDFYFRYLKHRYFPDNKKYVYISVNIANLLTERPIESTSRHIRDLASDANALDYETQCLRKPRNIRIAFLPIFGDGHWSLLVYRSQKHQLPEFLHFNSYLGSTRANHTQCARTALINLLYVFRENDPDMVISKDSYKLVVKNCPQQRNGNDCGVFVCMYAYILSSRMAARESEGRKNAIQSIVRRFSGFSHTSPTPSDRGASDRLLFSAKNANKDKIEDPEEAAWKIKDRDSIQPDDMRDYLIKVIHRATIASKGHSASL